MHHLLHPPNIPHAVGSRQQMAHLPAVDEPPGSQLRAPAAGLYSLSVNAGLPTFVPLKTVSPPDKPKCIKSPRTLTLPREEHSRKSDTQARKFPSIQKDILST